jgi:hypothetical protein
MWTQGVRAAGRKLTGILGLVRREKSDGSRQATHQQRRGSKMSNSMNAVRSRFGLGKLAILSSAAGVLLTLTATGQAQQPETGATIWSAAGCFNCHGNLAAGDGDAAYPVGPNLRRTSLDRDQLVETIACGRPSTAMPFHLKGAYTEVPCYGLPLGAPPGVTAGGEFSQEQIELLADFLMENVVGVTRITREACAAFFNGNQNAPLCLQY